MENFILLRVQEQEKMEEIMISNTAQSLSPASKPWKVYHNPVYSQHPDPSISTTFSSSQSNLTFAMETMTKSMNTELEEAKAQIIDLKAELEFERNSREKMEYLTKSISNELEEERRRREATDRVNSELWIQILSHQAEMGSIRREIDEEKKMMRVAEVFREGKVHMKLADAKILNQEKPFNEKVRRTQNESYGGRGGGFVSPISLQRRSASSPEPENPHIKRGIKGSVEFQRVVKAMCSNKSNNKHLGGSGNYKLECQKAQLKILLKQRSPVRPSSFSIS